MPRVEVPCHQIGAGTAGVSGVVVLKLLAVGLAHPAVDPHDRCYLFAAHETLRAQPAMYPR